MPKYDIDATRKIISKAVRILKPDIKAKKAEAQAIIDEFTKIAKAEGLRCGDKEPDYTRVELGDDMGAARISVSDDGNLRVFPDSEIYGEKDVIPLDIFKTNDPLEALARAVMSKIAKAVNKKRGISDSAFRVR